MAGPGSLGRDLAREQLAFLRRDRQGWEEHLAAARAFLGEGLASARRDAPALILGAGSGLQVPWRLAPAGTVGWDADPMSRLWTLLRHRRWAPWQFEDLTGGMADLGRLAHRCARRPGSGLPAPVRTARLRLTGLLDALDPQPRALEAWLGRRRPGTVLSANVMGQFGVAAARRVEAAFPGETPWLDGDDPLTAALDRWTRRAVAAHLRVLAGSGAALWLLHDRGVVFHPPTVGLGPLAEPWTAQLLAPGPVEASDPLCGVDVLAAFPGRKVAVHRRWLWPVAPGQVHVIEALALNPG